MTYICTHSGDVHLHTFIDTCIHAYIPTHKPTSPTNLPTYIRHHRVTSSTVSSFQPYIFSGQTGWFPTLIAPREPPVGFLHNL